MHAERNEREANQALARTVESELAALSSQESGRSLVPFVFETLAWAVALVAVVAVIAAVA